jgi:hypothetical protein
MKNFPDDELFDELGKRLGRYEENPDDNLWDGIAAGVRSAPRDWLSRLAYAAILASGVALTAWLLVHDNFTQPEKFKAISKNKHAVGAPSPKVVLPNPSSRPSISPRQDRSTATTRQRAYRHKPADETANSVRDGQDTPPVMARERERHNQLLSETSLSSDRPTSEVTLAPKASPKAIDQPDSAVVAQKKLPPEKDSTKAESPVPNIIMTRKEKGLSFYVLVNPSLSFQRVIPLSNDNIIVDKFFSAPVLSSRRFGFSFEAGVQGTLTSRWQYYGGLSYYQQTETLDYHSVSSDSVVISPSTSPDSYQATPLASTRHFGYNMKNIGVQGGLLYTLKSGRLSSQIGAGFLYQRGFLKSKSDAGYHNAQSQYLLYQLSYRGELKLARQLSFFIQPNFSYAFYSHEKLDQPFKLKPYRTGLSIGVLYRLSHRSNG